MTPAAQFAEYVIIRQIGSGNMGTVFLATRRDTGQQVAIKKILGGSSAEDQERLQVEEQGARVQQAIAQNERRVVAVNRVLRLNGDLIVEMEYVHGQDLSALIAAGMTPERAAAIALELCRMLQNLANLRPPVVHGDLKPRNILVCGETTVKVIDFGIAKHMRNPEGTFNAYQSIPYSSPERIRSGVVNAQSDLWAVAVMLYQMVAGVHPFLGSEGELQTRILSGNGPNPFPPQSGCPQPLCNIIWKALAHDSGERYTGPEEMADDLARFLAKQPVEAPEPDGAATRRTRAPAPVQADETVRTRSVVRRRTSWPRIIVAGLSGAACVLILYLGIATSRISHQANDVRRRLEQGAIPVQDAWTQYEALSAENHFPLTGLRDALKAKLLETGNSPILDYRHDQPTAREGDWSRAAEAFKDLLKLDPKNPNFAAGLNICQGHLNRIHAHYSAKGKSMVNQRLLNEAVENFDKARQLLPDSPDPFLGLARIYFYDEHDYDRGVQMLNELSKHHYVLGKREQLQKADGLRDRAMRELQNARQITDFPNQYKNSLEAARTDFADSLELYEQLSDFVPTIPALIRDTAANLDEVNQLMQGIEGPEEPRPSSKWKSVIENILRLHGPASSR